MKSTPKRLSIFGATGSIGASTERVLLADPDAFAVDAVTANGDWEGLARAARSLNASHAVLADETQLPKLRQALEGTGVTTAAGASALVEAAARPVDLHVAAIVGAAGVRPTFAALEHGIDVALANKECLVCAGASFMALAAARDVAILPVDSEHHAVLRLLRQCPRDKVRRVILTASGGPFRCWNASSIAMATREEALAHPTWSMGAKISVDSASLMNKGLELIEAHHLFQLAAHQLDVLVHPQSTVHALLETSDAAMFAELSPPDMAGPISTALYAPDWSRYEGSPLDLAAMGQLSFEEPDEERFPALRLARGALAAGGAMPTILNGANEIAVEAFLAGQLSFGGITACVASVIDTWREGSGNPEGVEEALEIDSEARRRAAEFLPKLAALAS